MRGALYTTNQIGSATINERSEDLRLIKLTQPKPLS